jgi:hypothetical protein
VIEAAFAETLGVHRYRHQHFWQWPVTLGEARSA